MNADLHRQICKLISEINSPHTKNFMNRLTFTIFSSYFTIILKLLIIIIYIYILFIIIIIIIYVIIYLLCNHIYIYI